LSRLLMLWTGSWSAVVLVPALRSAGGERRGGDRVGGFGPVLVGERQGGPGLA
jgi:hypothetical protein